MNFTCKYICVQAVTNNRWSPRKIHEYFKQTDSSKATMFHAKHCETIVFQDWPHVSANLPFFNFFLLRGWKSWKEFRFKMKWFLCQIKNPCTGVWTFANHPGNYLNMRASVSVFTGFLQTFNQKPVSQNISLDSTEKHRPWVSLSPCFIQYSSIFNIQYSSIQYSIQQNLNLNTKATNFN
jgi:hypothetical protein